MGGLLAYGGAAIGAGAGTVVLPGGGTIEGTAIGRAAGTALALGLYDLASYYAAGYTDDDILEAERGFVDGLGYSTINNSGLFTVSPSGWELASSAKNYLSSSGLSGYAGGFSYSGYPLTEYRYYSSFGNVISSDIVLPAGSYRLVFDSASGNSSEKFRYGTVYSAYLYGYNESSFDDIGYTYGYTDSFSDPTPLSFSTVNSEWTRYKVVMPVAGYLILGALVNYGRAVHIECLALSDSIENDPSARVSSLMQALNTYNIDNSYIDNSTNVNFFLVPTGQEPSEDTAVSPAIYDEETLVFTEPATGAQYQTTGWTYDYTTRTYDISLDAGTFSLDGTDVTRIVSTYGDELATITYYDASGNVLATDEYNYVMMSGSACSLNGHSYTYEIVKEPTCTTMGERKYTCTVCGDEYAEDVPASGHTHVFSVLKEPTCTAAGIGVYSCSSCGSEYTEPIPATNHTGQLLETVPSEFDENGVLISRGYSVYECSVCGTQYTVQDEISTDDGDWFSFMGDLLKSFLKTIVTALGAGLSKLFSAIADFFAWIFGFLSETVLSGIKNFFDAFGDDSSIFDGFRQENQDGSTTVVLPSGVSTVFQFASGVVLLLPEDLRLILLFGVAALFVIGVFKLRP